MMWNRAELKMRGNMAFKKNYVSAVVVALLMGIFGTVSGESSARRVSENSDIYSGNLFNVGMITGLLAGIATVVILIVLVAKVFVGNLLKMGGYRFFILNQTAQPGIGTLLDGFRSGHYVNIVLTMFLRDLFTTLWSLLLVVPGIVKHYEYLMVPYIIAENPAMDYKEAFQISKQMMDGEKMEAFIMDLSFLGWYLLSAVTCGLLAIFYVNPYVQASFAEMYTFNKQKAYQEVIADADKFEALDGSYASDKVAETAKAVLSASSTDFSKDDVSEVVAGIKNGKIIGFVVTVVAHDGYGGDIKFSVGLSTDGTYLGTSILTISETAGLGMRAKQDPSFLAQFNGTKTSEYKVVTDGTGSSSDSSIDAIGGSTVTSKAITKGVNAALAVYADLAKANVKTVGVVSVE